MSKKVCCEYCGQYFASTRPCFMEMHVSGEGPKVSQTVNACRQCRKALQIRLTNLKAPRKSEQKA